jgi:hypothetical protein
MSKMETITPKGKAEELIVKVRGLISKTFSTPYNLEDYKTKICAYDLAIEFTESIIASLKFYNLHKLKYWHQVKNELIELKLYFYVSQHEYITEELKRLKNN